MVITHDQLVVAMGRAAEGEFPLPPDSTTSKLLDETVAPALESLPMHLQCEVVNEVLKAVFVMGLSAGGEIR